MIVWFNGELKPLREVRISPFDRGFLVGDGVFETLVAKGGRIVAGRRHWERLCRSCEALGIPHISHDEFRSCLEAILDANDMSDARLRVTLTRGEGLPGAGHSATHPTWVAVATALRHWPATEKVVTSPWRCPVTGPLVGVKSVSYAGNVRALAHAHAQGAGEAVILNSNGDVCEGSGSNLFLVIKGRLVTPGLESGCLAGTARATVLEGCVTAGVPVSEEQVPASALECCEEAFLTSSTRDVHPIEEIDGRPLDPCPGRITALVQAAYLQASERESDWD
jgi:branched-chain amino acid aminotransferase